MIATNGRTVTPDQGAVDGIETVSLRIHRVSLAVTLRDPAPRKVAERTIHQHTKNQY